MTYCKLETFNFTEQSRYVHLLVGLIPGCIYDLAVVPFELMTYQNSYPLEQGIFNILIKIKVLLFDCVAVFVLVEYTLCNHQLVSVQIERGDEDSQEATED